MISDYGVQSNLLGVVRRFVDEKLIPAETIVADTSVVPEQLVEEMRALGLFGLTIPKEYGGFGLTMSAEVEIVFEIGRASPVFHSLVAANHGLGSQGIVINGTRAQKERFLPAMVAGNLIGAFAATEPEAGSDLAQVATTARRDGASWVLNGAKRYITNAPLAGIFTVLARTGPVDGSQTGLSLFLVERGAEGLSFGKPDKKMGHEGSLTCQVYLNECRLPADALLGEEGGGFKSAMGILDRARIRLGALCVAAAERLISEALKFSVERHQFGKSIGSFQLIQAMLADSQAEAYAARAMVVDAARRLDDNGRATLEASCCKLFSSEMVGRVADRVVQICGGVGYMRGSVSERFYRDVRLFRIYEGTNEMQRLIIAKNLFRVAGLKVS